jgi:TPP-dependent pyruvate/acetoin dehydrogenase alpha subunit
MKSEPAAQELRRFYFSTSLYIPRREAMKLERDQLLKLYVNLIRARRFDEAFIKASSEGKIMCLFHSGMGEEAVGVGACTFLRKDDYIYASHRAHGLPHCISKGAPPAVIFAEHAGKATGPAQGIGGSGTYISFPELGIFGRSGTIGSQFPVSAGWALAAKKRGKGQVVLCFFGDGAANRGTIHEAMNLASLWKLPVVYICSNNLIAQFMPTRDACASENIADMANFYRMPGVVVDGMDVVAVYEAVEAAVARARSGGGPSLIECKTYRFRTHFEGGLPDWCHADPRCKEEVEDWKKRDPVKLYQDKLLRDGTLTQKDVERIEREVAAEVEEAKRFAAESPLPDPSILNKALYAE